MSDRFSILASKVFSSEATEEEINELNNLIIENPKLLTTYNQLKEYWDYKPQYSFNDELTDGILDKIKSNSKKEVKLLYLKRIGIAASIVLLTILGFNYIRTNDLIATKTYVYASQSQPTTYYLSDGSKVTLNSNSSISFTSNFGSGLRNVKLLGEAHFDVSKDKSKPFIVEAKGTKTKVLGTVFNINAKEDKIITTLVEGAVLFTYKDCEEKLLPNDEIVYDLKSNSYTKEFCDVQLNTAWVNGRYNYPNITFGNYISKLSKIFNVEIVVNDDKLKDHLLSASFLVGEPLENILNLLAEELSFKYKINKNQTIVIYSKLK